MLAGGPPAAAPTKPLAERRPDLPPRIIQETEALITCDRDGAPPDVNAYLVSLGGLARGSDAETVPAVMTSDETYESAFSEEITQEAPVSPIEAEHAADDEAAEAVDDERVEVADAGLDAVVGASEEGRPLSGEIKTLPTLIETPERSSASVGPGGEN